MKCETNFHKAKGLGSAKSGVHHWILQRITAVALIPLGIWFVSTFIILITASYENARLWLSSPWTVTFSILLVLMTFYHGYLGMQVIWEDYLHHHFTKVLLILFSKIISIGMAILSIISILKVYLG